MRAQLKLFETNSAKAEPELGVIGAVLNDRNNQSSSAAKALKDLNPPQLEAVSTTVGPVLVLAGAGSGKTRVLTRRIIHLISSGLVLPDQILAVTFTNKAAAEMRHRLEYDLGELSSKLWISTFHSAAVRILRRYCQLLGYKSDFVIYDQDDSERVLKRVQERLKLDSDAYTVRTLLGMLKRERELRAETLALNSSPYTPNGGTAIGHNVLELYEKLLFQANAFDFDGLLSACLKLLKEHQGVRVYYQSKLRHVLVDEFQDTSTEQYEIVKILSEGSRNLFVVGDDDQSIYGFRGADIRNILEFERDFKDAKVIKLEQNYRSTANILGLANSVIDRNRSRKAKRLWTSSAKGELVTLFCADDEQEEANFVADQIIKLQSDGISLSKIGVLYRTNAQSRAIEEALMKVSLPYQVFGGLRFYERKEIKDVIAYLRLISNRADDQALLRIINLPARGIGAATIEKLKSIALKQESNLWQAAQLLEHKNVSEFLELIDNLALEAKSLCLAELIAAIVLRSGYQALLEKEQVRFESSRLENIRELQVIATSIERLDLERSEILTGFLERVALTAGDENPSDLEEQQERLSLTTLHLAKGLEFSAVFLIGFEEGLLPHLRSSDSESDIEEERRLCYVGITRARERLFITRARLRGLFHSSSQANDKFREVSRFAYEMSREFTHDLTTRFFEHNVWSDSSIELDPEIKERELHRESFDQDQQIDYEPEVWQPKSKKIKRSSTALNLLRASDLIKDP